ncbi:secondary thiamine-phosphate synthase enzyme YjbQ [Syntrophorhabdus aromaticivorans]|uniref:YjbQ family protein n=1 Tax=Syntrophorhabdus aromaticivorans TaxID=328301 RepID=A0A971M6P6_9BACT|nr:secondary thiamine-phosphate synthase enzyme YjbQ [Syntrophorhabdus aromaticivorans]NLW36895.1 YjbQ family protein [Syntrophorhabdus aromaticivorans]
MKIVTSRVNLSTRGAGDLINITEELLRILDHSALKNGTMTVFVSGSTAGITSFEYEPGLIRDLHEFYEKLVPSGTHYHHDDTWGDANGFSHVRATLTGPSFVIPFENGRLLLGTWQQVVLAEFDNRPRERDVVVQLMGE